MGGMARGEMRVEQKKDKLGDLRLISELLLALAQLLRLRLDLLCSWLPWLASTQSAGLLVLCFAHLYKSLALQANVFY